MTLEAIEGLGSVEVLKGNQSAAMWQRRRASFGITLKGEFATRGGGPFVLTPWPPASRHPLRVTTRPIGCSTLCAMTLVYDYPLAGVFWTMLGFFILIAWVMVVVGMLADVFRSDDLSGWGKAGWVLLIVILPIFGVVIYLIARGRQVSDHADQTINRQDAAYMGYVQRGR